MTSLANELGVTPSAIYNHAASKQEILDRVRESVFAEIDSSAFDSQHWVKALEEWAQSYLSVVLKNRQLLQALASSPLAGPAKGWPMYERVTSALVKSGWPPAASLSLIEAIEAFIFGSTVKEAFHQSEIENDDVGAIAPTYWEALKARQDSEVSATRSELFRIGLGAILTWSAERAGINLDPGPLRAATSVR